MAKGAVWMVFARVLDRGIGIVSTIILARGWFPRTSDSYHWPRRLAGLELLSIQLRHSLDPEENADRPHYDTVWTITLFGLSRR
jgi:hypothetical protein